jgi:hypothetical protein
MKRRNTIAPLCNDEADVSGCVPRPNPAMLTIFAIPKAFCGHIANIQLNAIASWTCLRPRPEIILFGDDPGTAAAAQEFGVHHVPEVERNQNGTPLLNDLFAKAERLAPEGLLCYVNSDIILLDDFLRAVERVRLASACLMMVGQRWDVDIRERLDFSRPDWQQDLRAFVRRKGKLSPPEAIDYFVFSKGLGYNLLPLAIGRTRWDNWLLWHARSQKAALIDATPVVVAIHQNHDYSHHPGGMEGVFRGEEAKRNRAMVRDWYRLLTIEDASHWLTPDGLKPCPRRRHMWLVVKRAWSHPRGMVMLIGRTLAQHFKG